LATRVRGSAAGAGWVPCGTNDSGALALALAEVGGLRGAAGAGAAAGDGVAAARDAGAGLAAAGVGDVTGWAALSD